MERELPGYYYDREKKKYFKIVPNHVAPGGTQYTKKKIEEIKQDERKRKRDEEQKQRLKGRVQRSRILNHPLGGVCCLNRELDSHNVLREQPIRAYSQGLEWRTTFSTDDSSEIQRFARDKATGGLVYGGRGFLRSITPIEVGNGSIKYARHQIKDISRPFTSDMTSINVGPTRTLVSTTLGDASKASIWLTKLVDPTQFDGTSLDLGIHIVLHPSDEDIWTSAVSKVDGTIAVGTSTGILILTETGSNWAEQRALKSNSDVLALEYLSPTTVAAGLRDNSVRLYDQRSTGKALRLRHPSSVTGIKQVDDWRVVVCGLQSSMRMYDLRSYSSMKTKKGSREATVPVLEYPYKNSFRVGLGFDVDTETRLVAAGCGDKGLQLFSLYSGEEMMPKAPSKSFPDFISCIQFSHGLDGMQRPKDLLASAGNSVDCFSW